MNKRQFLKTGLMGAAGLLSVPAIAQKTVARKRSKPFILPELPYGYHELVPFLDEQTLTALHRYTHAGYTADLNRALNRSDMHGRTVQKVLENASLYPSEAVNAGGGYLNLKIYWKSLSPGSQRPAGELPKAMRQQFGSFETFKKEFEHVVFSQDRPGWVWVISRKGSLKVVSTHEQLNPLMDDLPEDKKGYPVFNLCLHEYAMNPVYRKDRKTYVKDFWQMINWEKANQRYISSLRS